MSGGTFNRRRMLALGGAAAIGSLLPSRLLAGDVASGLERGLAESDVIYLTPLHEDGRESACQAEVWFVADGGDAYVVTASDAWRARAVKNGLDRARIWVGDVGVWTRSEGAYRDLPSMDARSALITDPAEHRRVLDLFGDKYTLEWIIWGPRFRNGLADGSRVMVRYQPA